MLNLYAPRLLLMVVVVDEESLVNGAYLPHLLSK